MPLAVTTEFTFDAAHRLLKYEGPCRNLHGHTYRLQVEVEPRRVNEPMVDGILIDFKELKEIVEGDVIASFDHTCILESNDPLVEVLVDNNCLLHIMAGPPTVENMIVRIATILQGNFDQIKYVKLKSVALWETPTCFAKFEC